MSFSIRRFVPAALLALALGGTSPITVVLAQQPVAAGVDAAASLQTDEVRLGAFFESVFQRNLAASPLFQSQIGIKGPDYGKWDDLSDAEQMRQHELDRKDLAVLHANFDYAVLSPQAQVSYRIFEFQQEQRLSGFEWRFHDYVFSTTSNPVTEAASFMQNIHEVSDVSDAEAYIARLEAIANAMDQSIVKLRQAAVRGIVPTSFSFDPVLEDIGSLLQGAPFDDSGKDCALLADFRAKVVALELDDGERERLLAAAMEALKGPFRAALDRFMVAVEELRPLARAARCLGAAAGRCVLPQPGRVVDHRCDAAARADPPFGYRRSGTHPCRDGTAHASNGIRRGSGRILHPPAQRPG